MEAGSYTLTARATDDKGAQTTSAPVTVTVNAVATVATIYYIYTDQLNTPRAITNEAATPVWKWDNNDPFGANAPNEDPDGDTNRFVFNLRFPGQYFDRETNTHYNYYRDYDPSQGRYFESDPIGLRSGTNTYAYVGGDPLLLMDRFGLDVFIAGGVAVNPGGFFTTPTSIHLSLQLIPNDPTAFANIPGFGNLPSGQFGSTLGGQPFGDPPASGSFFGTAFLVPPVYNNFPVGNLRGIQNYPDDANKSMQVRVSPPCGMTDTQFINALLAAFHSYGNNLPYSLFPNTAAGTYNSNSLVAGLLAATGKAPPPLSLAPFFQAPGYERPVPLQSVGSCVC